MLRYILNISLLSGKVSAIATLVGYIPCCFKDISKTSKQKSPPWETKISQLGLIFALLLFLLNWPLLRSGSLEDRSEVSFVQNFALPYFQAKTFILSFSPNFNSFCDEIAKNEWKWRNLYCWHIFYTGGTNLTSETDASGLFLIFHLYDFVYDFFPIVQTFLNSGCWKDDGHTLSVQLHVLFQEEAEDHLQGTTWVRLCWRVQEIYPVMLVMLCWHTDQGTMIVAYIWWWW